MKTPIIRLLILSAALMCNAAFAESGYVQHVRKNAEDGQAWAEKSMGDILYFGIGMQEDLNKMEEEEKSKKVAANYKKAYEWYRKAAKQGDSDAMHAVGRAYYFAEGIEEDDKKAAEWYRKAADAGDVYAIYSLARMYDRGIGVDKNPSEAEKLYLKAIDEHSDADSFYPLAQLYLNNPELNGSYDFILRLLLLAINVEDDKAAEHDLYSLRFLSDDISPSQYKEILNSVHNDLQVNWDVETQNSVSDISVKIEVVEQSVEALSAEAVFNRVWRSVVYIETAEEGFVGSGVIVQPNVVATNCHVVENATKHENFIWVYQSSERSGIENTPYYVSWSPVPAGERDYCLLYVPLLPGSGIPATIRRYDTLKIGETVYALGAPNGEKLSLSKGIISQLRDEANYSEGYIPARSIQSDVDIAGGSSGGGLFDSAGNLIGHTTASSVDNEGIDLEGLEFSIPADIVLEFGKKPIAE